MLLEAIQKFFKKLFISGQKVSALTTKLSSSRERRWDKTVRSALERRQEILEVLCERRHETVDNLATEFCVAERTIRRDLEHLTLSYPIYTTQGKGGGVHVVEGFSIGKRYLTGKQRDLLEKLKEGLNGEDLATMQAILKTFGEPKRR
ncbi:MAG: DeoR family transcriptional regulator [Clostridia bacterium]|nr:DeoR family transcriptional regulator [Clostridia bacterium]